MPYYWNDASFAPCTVSLLLVRLFVRASILCALKLSCLVCIFNRWLYPVLVKISLRFFFIIILYFDCLSEGVHSMARASCRTPTNHRAGDDFMSNPARNDFHFMTPVNRFIEPYLFILIFCQFSCTISSIHSHNRCNHIEVRTYSAAMPHRRRNRRQHNLLIKSLNKYSMRVSEWGEWVGERVNLVLSSQIIVYICLIIFVISILRCGHSVSILGADTLFLILRQYFRAKLIFYEIDYSLFWFRPKLLPIKC